LRVPIPLPDRERLPPGPIRDVVQELHHLYDRAGQPPGRKISRAIYRTRGLESVSHETVSAVLRGDTIPAWEKVRSIVTVLAQLSVQPVSAGQLAQLLEHFHGLWIASRQPATAPAEEQPPASASRVPPGEAGGPAGGASTTDPAPPPVDK
jgi:hypothetical protein